MRKIFLNKNKGFTLVETLVSISIFTASILGLLSILATGISNTSYVKQKLIAGYLAQEGIEYIRNLRDTYALYNPGTGWGSFVSKLNGGTCAGGNGCYFTPVPYGSYTNHSSPVTAITIAACGSSCPPLLFDASSGVYGYASGSASGFTRTVRASQISADEIRITSTVSWQQGSGNYSTTFSEDLFNWME